MVFDVFNNILELIGIIAQWARGDGPTTKSSDAKDDGPTPYVSRTVRLVDTETGKPYFLLATGTTRIGRSTREIKVGRSKMHNNITFNYSDISRFHCEITSIAHGYAISVIPYVSKKKPGGERNRTEVRSVTEESFSPVSVGNPRTLKNKDLIRLGSHIFEYRDDEVKV